MEIIAHIEKSTISEIREGDYIIKDESAFYMLKAIERVYNRTITSDKKQVLIIKDKRNYFNLEISRFLG